tara:strand:+ start:622 stop:981 length:360 start_codon:yes stop_codon:yes gene_type:complete
MYKLFSNIPLLSFSERQLEIPIYYFNRIDKLYKTGQIVNASNYRKNKKNKKNKLKNIENKKSNILKKKEVIPKNNTKKTKSNEKTGIMLLHEYYSKNHKNLPKDWRKQALKNFNYFNKY